MKNLLRFPCFATLVFAVGVSCLASAQAVPTEINAGNATGIQAYNLYGGVRENINLATGGVNLSIPLVHLPGRNGMDLDLSLVYDSKIWLYTPGNDPFTGAFDFWSSEAAGIGKAGWKLAWPSISRSLTTLQGGQEHCTVFIVKLADGSKHSFPNQIDCYHKSLIPPYNNVMDPQLDINIGHSQDAEFLDLDTTNHSDIVVRTKSGMQIHSGGTIKDSNGNTLSYSGTSFTDTLGRVVSIASGCPATYSYKDSNGQLQNIALACTNMTITQASSCNPRTTTSVHTRGQC